MQLMQKTKYSILAKPAATERLYRPIITEVETIPTAVRPKINRKSRMAKSAPTIAAPKMPQRKTKASEKRNRLNSSSSIGGMGSWQKL